MWLAKNDLFALINQVIAIATHAFRLPYTKHARTHAHHTIRQWTYEIWLDAFLPILAAHNSSGYLYVDRLHLLLMSASSICFSCTLFFVRSNSMFANARFFLFLVLERYVCVLFWMRKSTIKLKKNFFRSNIIPTQCGAAISVSAPFFFLIQIGHSRTVCNVYI